MGLVWELYSVVGILTGGLSTLAQIIQKYSGLSLSVCVVLMDGIVIALAGFILSPEKALYALIGLYITGKIIDMIELGLNYTKVAYIIANKTDEITEAVLNELDRGLTKSYQRKVDIQEITERCLWLS